MRRILILALSAVLLLMAAVPAFAEETEAGDWDFSAE